MKLMIAVPTLDYVHFEFTRCLVGLAKRLCEIGVDYDICFKGGTLVYLSRDALAAEAINSGYTHVLWLDADMLFEPNVFEKLLAHGKDIVSGVYHSRHAPYKSTIYTELDPPKIAEKYPDGLFEIAGCGFGIVLTSADALKSIFKKHGFAFQPRSGFGEDLSFCLYAKEVGYEIYCDPAVIAGHIGHVVIWPEQ